MKKVILLHLLILCTCFHVFSQGGTEKYKITLPSTKAPNSLYNSIHFLDSRHDTTNLGFVQVGAFNKKVKVVPASPLSAQLNKVLSTLIDKSAKEGELLLQLRQFSFSELTTATTEKGYCYLRANLYAKNKDVYQTLSVIDTVIMIKGMEVTNPLFKTGSKVLTQFISKSLTKEANNPTQFTFEQIKTLDSIEKQKLKLYTTSAYAEGLYTSYASFRDQVPDYAIQVETTGNKFTSIKVVSEDGKTTQIRQKEVYAFVHDGQPYIVAESGIYPLIKKEEDFVFVGKQQVSVNTGDVISASLLFGMMGEAYTQHPEAMFEMKIDHLNGGFIRLKEVN